MKYIGLVHLCIHKALLSNTYLVKYIFIVVLMKFISVSGTDIFSELKIKAYLGEFS